MKKPETLIGLLNQSKDRSSQCARDRITALMAQLQELKRLWPSRGSDKKAQTQISMLFIEITKAASRYAKQAIFLPGPTGDIKTQWTWSVSQLPFLEETAAFDELTEILNKGRMDGIALCEQCQSKWLFKYHPSRDRFCSARCRKAWKRQHMTPEERFREKEKQHERYVNGKDDGLEAMREFYRRQDAKKAQGTKEAYRVTL